MIRTISRGRVALGCLALLCGITLAAALPSVWMHTAYQDVTYGDPIDLERQRDLSQPTAQFSSVPFRDTIDSRGVQP